VNEKKLVDLAVAEASRHRAEDMSPSLPPPDGSMHGWQPRLDSAAAVQRAVELAFDYRGDVTITLSSGEQLVGYVFNRDFAASEPFFDVYPVSSPASRRIPLCRVVGLAFTGADAAEGKSWDAWLRKVAQAESTNMIANLYPDD
jgi:hypothetical protein